MFTCIKSWKALTSLDSIWSRTKMVTSLYSQFNKILFLSGAAVGGWSGSTLASRPAWPPSTRMWSWVRTPTRHLRWPRSGRWKNTQKRALVTPMVLSTSREGRIHTEPRWEHQSIPAGKAYTCIVYCNKHTLENITFVFRFALETNV